jgi:tetratricopeptide (TPR) repeat protein
MAYSNLGKLPQAIAVLEQQRDTQVRLLGSEHVKTLGTMNNLAAIYQQVGKLPLAIEMLERVREATIKTLGPDHPHTFAATNNLAQAYRMARRVPEAIALFEVVRDAQLALQGPDHPETMITVGNLAMAYASVRKTEQALQAYRQVAEALEKRKYQHPHGEKMVVYFLDFLERNALDAEAETWRQKYLVVLKAKTGADGPVYAVALADLGLNRLRQRKWTEAELVLRESLTLHEKNAPDDWGTSDLRSRLGEALLGQEKYADAEPLLLGGYQGMSKREDSIPEPEKYRLRLALERLVRLYDAWGKKDQADLWRKMLEKSS